MGETASGGAQKICCICGTDCAGRQRTKDRKGRYYCQPCYDEALRRRREKKSGLTAPVAEVPSIDAGPDAGLDMGMLDEIVGVGPALEVEAQACPRCGRPMDTGAVICTGCGYNVQTGSAIADTAIRSSAPSGLSEWAWWPLDLFVRPRRFFDAFALRTHAIAIAAVAFLCGMAGMIDRIQTRQALAAEGRDNPIMSMQWDGFWAIVAGGGVIAALFYFAIGGWWYRVRLRWSGDGDADIHHARRVYMLASVPWALPVVLATLVGTVLHKTPLESWNANPNVFDLLVVIGLFWSIWVSFVGVRTVFDTRRVLAVIWFLVLPITFYSLILGAAFVIGFLMAVAPPDVSHPAHLNNSVVRVQYPGNWWAEAFEDGGQVVEAYIESPRATVTVLVYWSERTPEEELAATMGRVRVSFAAARPDGDLRTWGSYSGTGKELTDAVEGVRIRLFVTSLPDGRLLEIQEVCDGSEEAEIEPGFALIRSTLSVN